MPRAKPSSLKAPPSCLQIIVYEYRSVRVQEDIGIWVMLVYWFIGVLVYGYVGMWVYGYIGVFGYWDIGILGYWDIGILGYRVLICTDISVRLS